MSVMENFYGAFLSFVEAESHLIAGTILQNCSFPVPQKQRKLLTDFFYFFFIMSFCIWHVFVYK